MSARLPNWPSGSSSRLLPAAAFGFGFAVRRLFDVVCFALALAGVSEFLCARQIKACHLAGSSIAFYK
jgi:hypothetical protein